MALWTPAEISTALWLDAADSSTLFDAVSGGNLVAADGAVARWEDKSGNGRSLTQGTPVLRPQRKTSIQNGKDVLRFDGLEDGLETSFASFGAEYSVVVVAFSSAYTTSSMASFASRSNTSAVPINPQVSVNGTAVGDPCQFIARDNLSNFASASANNVLTNSTWNLFGGSRDGNNFSNILNGSTIATATATIGLASTNITSVGYLYSAAARSAHWDGDVAEVVVGALADRQLVEGYLAWKWGTQGSLPNDHPYKNAAPRTGALVTIIRQHYAAQGAR
jgi:hypothetical protein